MPPQYDPTKYRVETRYNEKCGVAIKNIIPIMTEEEHKRKKEEIEQQLYNILYKYKDVH